MVKIFQIILMVYTLVAGYIACAQPGGSLKLSNCNPHYAEFRGEPVLLLGSTEHYGAVINLDFDYVKYLDQLQNEGFNLTRTWNGIYREDTNSFGITNNTLAPKTGRFISPWMRSETPGYHLDGNKFDLNRWDEKYFDRLKDFVAQAEKRGIVVEIGLFCFFHFESTWNLSPMNPKNNINHLPEITRQEALTLLHPEYLKVQEAYIRKIVTELKDFDNIFYELINEPYSGLMFHSIDVKQDWQDWVAGIIVDTEKNFGNKHLLQQNIPTGIKPYNNPNPNVSILSFHYAVGDDAALNYPLNKLLNDGETGFAGPYEHPYRQEAWHFFLNGGGMFNHLDYSFIAGYEDGTYQMPESSPGWGGKKLRNQFIVLKNFFRALDFVNMKPDTSLLAGFGNKRIEKSVFAKKDSVYVAYFSRKRKDRIFNYSMKFTGLLAPVYSEKYTFYTQSDDGIRLWLDDKLLIDNWTSHSRTTDSASIVLSAGQKAKLRVEYFNGLYGASLDLLWKSKSQPLEIIPATAFITAGNKPGLAVQYFENMNLKNPTDSGRCSSIHFDGNIYALLDKENAMLTIHPTVKLGAGSYTATWINPLDGKILKTEKLKSNGSPLVIHSPAFVHDALVKICRQ